MYLNITYYILKRQNIILYKFCILNFFKTLIFLIFNNFMKTLFLTYFYVILLVLELTILNLTLFLPISLRIQVPNQLKELQANKDVEKYCPHKPQKYFVLGNNMFTNNLCTKLKSLQFSIWQVGNKILLNYADKQHLQRKENSESFICINIYM